MSKFPLKEIQKIEQQSEGLVKIINDLNKLIENIKSGNKLK